MVSEQQAPSNPLNTNFANICAVARVEFPPKLCDLIKNLGCAELHYTVYCFSSLVKSGKLDRLKKWIHVTRVGTKRGRKKRAEGERRDYCFSLCCQSGLIEAIGGK